MAAFYFGPAACAELIFYSPFMAGRVQQATTKRRDGSDVIMSSRDMAIIPTSFLSS